MNKKVFVSVIMPVLNEERYIDECLKSLLAQDYPQEKMEWIFVDGNSRDRTVDILNEYKNKYPDMITIYSNKNITAPYAMNIGIENAKGEYIIRLDAHAKYEPYYISKCVECLDTVDADNVGGMAITEGKGFTGKCIAKMLSSRFGVGNSQFRTNGTSGYVDTVPFGAYKREVFEKWGNYDTRLSRNEDNELNYRIRKNGGKVYLSNDIRFTYYCRDSISGICKMAFNNGKWNIVAMLLCPGSMGIRHFIPMLFVLSIIFLAILGMRISMFNWLLYIELLLYFLLDLFFSAKLADSFKEMLMLLFLFPVFHIAYGIGSISSIGLIVSTLKKPDNSFD